MFKVDVSGVFTPVESLPYTGGNSPRGIFEIAPGLFTGVTLAGGPTNEGTVYRWTAASGITTPFDFAYPLVFPDNLKRGPDGSVYGIAPLQTGGGMLFKLDALGQPVPVHTFTAAEGGTPGAFTFGPDGDIYGTNRGNGFSIGGTLFRIDSSGIYTALHVFDVAESQGLGALIPGADGYLYGANSFNGPANHGSIYRATYAGDVTTLFNFAGPDGDRPNGLVQGPGHVLYGITYIGGTASSGTVFTFDTDTSTLVTRHHFDGVEGGGALTIDPASDGNLYVTTGGALSLTALFKTDPAGNILWTFKSSATQPTGPVVEGSDGNLYGAAPGNGPAGGGGLFRIRLRALTTTSLITSSNPSTYGASLTLQATVGADSGTPTGTVEFFDGALSLGSAPLSGGVATLAVSTLATGPHSLSATYGGSTAFEPSSSAPVDQTIVQATPSITWPPPADVVFGTPLGAAQLNATASVPGTFAYTPAAGTVLSQGVHSLSVEFTPTDGVNYAHAFENVDITVLPAPPPVVTLTTPNGGDSLYALSPFVITWDASGGAGGITRFDVSVSTNGGTSYTPIAACSNVSGASRSCTWNAPGPTTSKGRIKVTATDALSNTAFDASNANFKIAAGSASVTVSVPNTALNWAIGSHQTISWKHNLGVPARFRIELSRDGGATYPEVIASSVPASTTSAGSYVWLVTGPAASARVRITSLNTPSATDIGNVNFTIAPATLTLTAPKAKVAWGYGSDQSITWTSNLGAGDLVDVQLSTDGGATWPTTLASGIDVLAKTATVTTPTLGAQSTTARLRLVWANPPGGLSGNGLNPGNFTIQPPVITVTAPNGGNIWAVGSSQTIKWKSNLGSLENVTIELSTDGGATYPIVVLGSTPSDGSQAVVVQAPWISPTAKIRVTWVKAASVADVSNATFVVQ